MAGTLDRSFILHVGSNARRKNRPALVRLIARLKGRWDGKLVLAGERMCNEMRAQADDLGVAERIVEVEKPDGFILEALYNRSFALVFPSTYEGFGWPIIEAQACGCPVICSNADPFEEILGNSAIRIPVEQEEKLCDAILSLQENALRADLRERGLFNAQRFAPRRMIDQYIDVYATVLAQRKGSSKRS
jgi:glycosyltransferase involved in cell wall biosynthesis